MNGFLPLFVKALSDAGVPLLIGTDATSLNFPGWAAHVEIRDLVAAGLTPYQALRVATRNAGLFVGQLVRPTDRFGISWRRGCERISFCSTPTQWRISPTSDSLAGVMARGRWWTVRQLRALRDERTRQYDQVKALVVRFDAARSRTISPRMQPAASSGPGGCA